MKARWLFMYALSTIIGYVVLIVRLLLGDRFSTSTRALIRRTATRHADRYAGGLEPVDPDEDDCDSCGCLDCEDRP